MSERMKRAISRLASACGYTIVPNWRVPGLAMATRVRDIFSYFQIDTVIDVGANNGQYRDFLRLEVGFDGQIHSFEPVPEIAERLKKNAIADPRWSVNACALGREPGQASINVMAGTVFSSFRSPIPVENAHQNRMNTVIRTVSVPVTTLDAHFGEESGHSNTFVKLDTQGFDLEVLAGGPRMMAAVPALQTEISFRPFYEGVPSYGDAISAFERYGFKVADLFLVSTDGMHRAMEFDCLMVRSP